MSAAQPPLPCVVVVEFRVRAEQAAEFARLVLENAQASRSLEPGCRIFDVCRFQDDEGHFLLYEVYVDESAFRAHLKTPHFLAFDQQVRSWMTEKTVRTLGRLDP